MKEFLETGLVVALAAAAVAMAQSGTSALQRPDKDCLTKTSDGIIR